jgi:hypothetical protein
MNLPLKSAIDGAAQGGFEWRQMSGYNSNLAGEFYVLSMLHRLGADATLTLGNKKSVDIVVVRGKAETLTIDVKALAGKTGWPVDNFDGGKKGHFIALVCFLGKIEDPTKSPEVYIVPSALVEGVTTRYASGRKNIQLSTMRTRGKKYRDAWRQLL